MKQLDGTRTKAEPDCSPEPLSSPTADDPRVIAALEEYAAALRQGQRPKRQEFLARHAGLGSALSECLDGLDMIHSAAGELETDASGEAADPLVGTLGDFRLLGEIGRGGMGVVYEAEQISLGRRVALKVLPFAATMDKRQLQRFHNEARAAACLHHNNIVPVYAVGCKRGVHYYAMQFIEGKSLDAVLHEMRQSAEPEGSHHAPRDAGASTERNPHAQANTLLSQRHDRAYFHHIAELAVQAAEALEHAHQSGVIHRDVKPGNLLLDEDGTLWIADFGLAQVQTDTRLTLTGDLVGTLRYMSPEQALAKRVIVDHRTDIYSLGATFYELLTLKPVFAGRDRQEMLRQIAFEEPVSLRRLNRGIPIELETVILKAVEKNPADRYGSAKELAEDLKRFLKDEPTLARRPRLWQRGQKWGRRHVAAVRAGAAALLVVLAVLGGTAGWWVRDQEARETEKQLAVTAAVEETERLQNDRRTQERAAREVATGKTVTALLTDAKHLYKARRVPEALEKAKQAAAILASGAGTPALAQRVKHQLADLAMLMDLEDVRIQRTIVISMLDDDNKRTSDARYGLDYAGAALKFALVFREYGMDLATLPVEESARRILERTVHVELAAALDDWLMTLRMALSTDEVLPKRILAVARSVDPDPWRNRIREVLEYNKSLPLDGVTTLGLLSSPNGDGSLIAANMLLPVRRQGNQIRLDYLNHLVDSVPVEGLPAATVIVYAKALEIRFAHKQAVQLLRTAQRHYPTDFEINYALSATLFRLKPPPHDEIIRFGTAALAIRPDSAAAHNSVGAALRAQGRFGEAVVAFHDAIRLKPNFPAFHNNLGIALEEKGQFNEAIAAFREAIHLKADYADAHHGLGVAFANKGFLDEAIRSYQEAVRLRPNYAQAYYNLGLVCAKKDQFDSAIEAQQQAILHKPDYHQAYTSLGNAFDNNGQFKEAMAAYRKAIELKPNYAEAHDDMGFAFAKNGQLDEAIVAFTKAIEIKPNFGRAYHNLGNALADKKELDKAIAAYRKAIDIDPKNAASYRDLGQALADNKQLDQAIAAYRKTIDIDPKNAASYSNLGNALADKKQWDEAFTAYRKAIDINPNYAPAHYNLGIAYKKKGQINDAITALQEATRQDPEYAVAYSNLGAALLTLGRLEEGVRACQNAVRLGRGADSAGDWSNLGMGYEQLGRMKEAIAAYKEAINREPNLADVHNNLAWLLATCEDQRLRNANAAVASAKKAVELRPKVGDFWNTLGVAHYRNGEWQLAVNALDRSVKLRKGGDSLEYYFLAMAHRQLDRQDQARSWYDKGVQWMKKNNPKDAELLRFRAEAAELLGVELQNEPAKK